MKNILLFLLLALGNECRSQMSTPAGKDGNIIISSSYIIKEYCPDVYNSVVQHSNMQLFVDSDGERFSSTNRIEGGNPKKYWILLGIGSVRERSPYHLAAVIYHESMHILIAEKRMRNGESGYFSDLSPKQQKQEEFLIYKMEIDLLKKMNASQKEIQEIREWMEPYKPR
jgi:hypothetical protein